MPAVKYTAPPDQYLPFTACVSSLCNHASNLQLSGALHSVPHMPQATCTQTPCRPCLSSAEGAFPHEMIFGWIDQMPPTLSSCEALSQHCPKA